MTTTPDMDWKTYRGRSVYLIGYNYYVDGINVPGTSKEQSFRTIHEARAAVDAELAKPMSSADIYDVLRAQVERQTSTTRQGRKIATGGSEITRNDVIEFVDIICRNAAQALNEQLIQRAEVPKRSVPGPISPPARCPKCDALCDYEGLNGANCFWCDPQAIVKPSQGRS